jgi:hypothetical protein
VVSIQATLKPLNASMIPATTVERFVVTQMSEVKKAVDKKDEE